MGLGDHLQASGNESLPRVTVVTPSFQQAAYLDETIRSVLTQDYPNLEYMVVDGGSTDGSVELIRRRESALSWWISEPDRGHAHAVNKGWERSTGEILAFLNSDDVYLPGAIRAAVDFFLQCPDAEIVYGDAVHITEDGRVFNVSVPPPFSVERMLESCFITQPTVFLRRSVFERLGGLTEHLGHSLDYEYWLRAIPTTQFGYLPRFTAAARYHTTAKSTAGYNEFARDEIRLFDELFSRGKPPYTGPDLERAAYLPRLAFMVARLSGYTEKERADAAERLKHLAFPPTAEEITTQVTDNRMYLGTPYRPLDPSSLLAAHVADPDPYMIVAGLAELSVIDDRTARLALTLATDSRSARQQTVALARALLRQPQIASRASWWLEAGKRAAPWPLRRIARRVARRTWQPAVHPLVGLSLDEVCVRQGLTDANAGHEEP